MITQKLYNNFRIGVGRKTDATVHKIFLDFHIVFDNAVMHKGNFAVLTDVGMSIDIIRFTVGCPAGMTNP